MKHSALLHLASLLFLFGVALPQEPTSHEQAAAELLQLMGLERTMSSGFVTTIDIQLQANPALAPYRDVMVEWAGKYLTWDTMAPAMVKLYVEEFTEPEIQEINAFYRTPTGQKALAKMPELMQKGAAIGADVAKIHEPELQKMLSERRKQLESGSAP